MEKNETTQQAFVFHPSFWNALKELDDNSLKNEIAFAIISYGNEGEVELAELSPVARFAMRLIMPIIDKQQETYRRKRDAGKSGGRPKNENQKGENEKPIQNQTPDFEKANQNQNCNPEKADDNQDESRNSRRLGKEKEKDIFFNKDIEKEKDIVFLKEKETENATEVSDDKNKKTDLNFSEIKKYFVGKGFDESTAQRFIDYNINHNKKVQNDWKHYADKWIEN
ncbi:MAG: hypothetical protein J6Z01_05585 [Bacteroidales bacterium]|nr:hypothetical protein [Bacteroidales bacterium]